MTLSLDFFVLVRVFHDLIPQHSIDVVDTASKAVHPVHYKIKAKTKSKK